MEQPSCRLDLNASTNCRWWYSYFLCKASGHPVAGSDVRNTGPETAKYQIHCIASFDDSSITSNHLAS
jgi:hypothetical protein